MASKFQETNSFVLDEFLDTFGREFCKHEVLWKPQPNCKEFGMQSPTYVAYRTLAQALNLSLEVVLELLETFPAACLDLLSHYELRRKIDASCCMPNWLMLLAGHLKLVNKSRKYNKSAAFARHELVQALCESARMGLGAGPAVCSAADSSAGSAAGSSAGSSSGLAAGSAKGSSAGSSSGLAAGSAKGSSSGLAAGSAAGSSAGSSSGLAAGSAAGSAVGSSAGSSSGLAAGSAAGSSAGSSSGLAAGSAAGSSAGSSSGLASGSAAGASAGSSSGLAAGSAAGSSAGSSSGLAAGSAAGSSAGSSSGLAAGSAAGSSAGSSSGLASGSAAGASAGDSANGTAVETEVEASPLRGPQAVAYFVARHGVSEEEVLPAWRSALELSVVKLRAMLVAGDRVRLLPPALRPAADERALADLALLHDRSVSQIKVLTPAKLRTLVLLFQLIVAAKIKYDEERRREGGGGRSELRSDESAPTPVESSDDEPHPELDPELVTLVISSDTSDKVECSKNNIEVPVLLDECRVEESGSNMMEKTNASYRERESCISSKSETRIKDPTQYWYEESESNTSEKRKAVWALVYTDFIKRGRSASLISLQHRWVELLHLARSSLLTAWNSDNQADKNVHPLLLAVAHWCPKIVTDDLPSWEILVSKRQIVLESDIKDIIPKYQKNVNLLLNVSEDLSIPYLLKKYVIHRNIMESNSKASNKHVDCQINIENPTSIINNTDKDSEQESQINNELNVNNNIIPMLDQIDPSQAKVSIVILDDSDEDDKDNNSTNTTETTSNLNESNSEQGATYLREENNHIPYNLENRLTEITKKNIEKELKDNVNCINNSIDSGSDLFVRNNRIELNEKINDNNELLKNKQTGSQGLGSQDDSSFLEPCKPVIVTDEKLVNLSRVVVTPIEHLPEWKKHSRNGVIKCRNFSVRNFTKPVMATSEQLSRCTPYINTNTNNNDSEKCEDETYRKNTVRIKFEDDSFETDFDFGDDINNGIKYQKYIELYTMADHMRKNRIKLTRKLKLSRTYFSLKFWSLDSNIELLKLCKPISIKLNKGIPRVAKRVELPDITEVRRINRSILTAQVSPTIDTTVPHTQKSCASQEAVNSTNNSISLDSGTIRKTNNSLSSAVDSQELLNILTNYAIKTKINKKSVIESVTKDITSNSNLMDSILETMRLADKNNIQNSTLQQNPFPSCDPSDSCNTNISATNTFHTTQKYTEEVRNISINNSLGGATAGKIYFSSKHTKDLYMKHLQKMNNINNTSFKPKEARMPNVGDLKDMILLLVKQFDTEMTQEYNMKLNRSSLNLHLKKFEKQQRALVKNISKLTKILPQYVVNMKPKRIVDKYSTAGNKQKINRIKCKQSKELSTIPSSHTENITDVAINTNSVFGDDDCELNLVIDEGNPEQSFNVDFNNSQCNKIDTNKDIQKTSNRRKNDKKEKNIKKSKKRLKQPKIIPEIEKPILNEYQEWHRQKTMALKYFTLPTFDTSKLTSKGKIAKQKSTTTSTEQQSNGCQTNISIERKNAENLRVATTSTEQQSNGCQTNISIERKNAENLRVATTSTEQQSNGCQTNISIERKNTENLRVATTSTEQQSNGCQTNISIERKNAENLRVATTSTEQQSNGCQTNISIERKNAENLRVATTSTEQQSNGCQTNITMKRKNTEVLATTSTVSDMTKRSKLNSNERNVIYISDTSSDDEVQITDCYIAKDTNENSPNTTNTTQPDIHQIDKMQNGNKIVFLNETSEKQAASTNVCVINTPVADITQPVYLLINDTQTPAATTYAMNKTQASETINNYPIVFQVLSNGTLLPTLLPIVQQNKTQQTQKVVTNDKCQRTNKCKCVKCENTLRDDILTSSLDVIQNVTSLVSASGNNEPSTSLPTQNDRLNKEAITVKEYLEGNKKLTALIKVDSSQKLLFFCSKYIILTDVNIPSANATYRTTTRINNKKKLTQVLIPNDSKGSVLLLGSKKESDFIHCECLQGTTVRCNICQQTDMLSPNPAKMIKIGGNYYKHICEKSNKYVRLNDKELATNSRRVLEGNPHLILINKMFFKKLTDSPSTYVRILSAPSDAATLRHLVRKEVVLYAFDIRDSEQNYTPLKYAQTDGQVTVDHTDEKLINVLQWILN